MVLVRWPNFSRYYSAASETDKDIAKKDLVGYGVSLMERGGGACKEGLDRGAPPPLTISSANGYPRLAHHRPIQSVYWHCPER